MRIRRPVAALLMALSLFGGGASLTACQAAGQGQNDGTTDDTGEQDSGEIGENENGGPNSEGDDDQSNQERNDEDDGDDQQDPD